MVGTPRSENGQNPARSSNTGGSGGIRKARRYGFACAACKTRKVKCSGEQPICAGCRRSGEDCVWPLSKAAETRLRDTNAASGVNGSDDTGHSAGETSPASGHGEGEGEESHSQSHQRLVNSGTPTHSSAVHSHRRLSGLAPGPSPLTTITEATPCSRSTNTEAPNSLWFQVGIGENGDVIYNGPTSRFHAGSLDDDGGGGQHLEDDSELKREHMTVLRGQYALMDSVWMPLIAAKPTMDGTGVDTRTGVALLEIYWNWLHPLHSCVYRPIMLMDLALGGPHCSDFLLLCIFGLAARHLPKNSPDFQGVAGQGEELIQRARTLLLREMSAPCPRIPTIQGLLILGGRQCAMGNNSEGWLYTGMAIRMMTDMGLHLDIVGLARLERWTPAEIEARKRLYNSAYLWDKTLSLSLGRFPSLTRRPYPAGEILDKFDDERVWRPVHATELCAESFSPTPAWSSSTFCSFSSLHEITTDMVTLFSASAGTAESFSAQVEDLDGRCRRWYDETPVYLRIDEPDKLEQSPPPHIVSLNLLYHTLHILLRRPYLNAPSRGLRDEHLKECTVHSRKIHAIHQLYTKTFPHRLITYQISYCIYTAATVEAFELKQMKDPKGQAEAASRLAAAVTVLQKEASHTPGSGRSLDTIRRLLSAGQRAHPQHVRERLNEIPAAAAAASAAAGSRLVEASAEHVNGVHQGSFLTHGSASNGQDINAAAASLHHTTADEMGQHVPMWDDDFAYPATNTGAGFHPDAFPWWSADSMPRMPLLPTWGHLG